jgi:hypothetical protein
VYWNVPTVGTREVGEAYAVWSEPFERLIRRPSTICVMGSAKLKIRLLCVTATTAQASFGAWGAEAELPPGLGGRDR